jgi:hypothetical protein
MAYKQLQISVTPDRETYELLTELSELSGMSRAGLIRDMLVDMRPMLRQLIGVLRMPGTDAAQQAVNAWIRGVRQQALDLKELSKLTEGGE